MGWCRRNQLLALRCGAAVVLTAAGTLTAIIVSERSVEPTRVVATASASGQAHRSQVSLSAPMQAQSERATPLSDDLLSMDGLSLQEAMVPLPAKIVTEGSTEESRRQTQGLEDAGPPTRPRQRCGNHDSALTCVELYDYIEWWKTTPNGQLLEEITSYDPTRTATTVHLLPQVSATVGKTGFGSGEQAPVGTISNSDGTRPRGEADLYDFTVRMDASGVLPPTSAVGLGVAAGLRAASLFDLPERDNAMTEPLPVMGGDASLRWGAGSMLRASAMGEAPGVIRDYLDLRLEQVWSLGGASSFSVGWRHLRGIVSNELPEPTVRQDAILLELRLGF